MEHSLDNRTYSTRRIALLNVKRVQIAARITAIAGTALGVMLLMLLK